jgi:hypothetical protein
VTTTDSATTRSTAPAHQLVLDRLMPRHDVRVVQHVVVDAPTDTTYAAIDRLDFNRDRLVAAVGAVRLLPERIRRRRQGEPLAGPDGDFDRFAAMWTPLADVPGDQKVLGLVGAFWERDTGLIKVAAEDFTAFDRPGFGKVAMGYVVSPYGSGSILTLEIRVALTDDTARRRFRRYWMLIGPGARFTTARMLRLIKADAEGQTPAAGVGATTS